MRNLLLLKGLLPMMAADTFLFSLSNLSSLGAGLLIAMAAMLYVTLTIRGLISAIRHG